MSYTVTNAPDYSRMMPRGAGPSIDALLIRILKRLQTWLEKRAVLRELHALDGRTLQDLGIYATDFDSIADGTYTRRPRSR
jgi:uncharacterized protein YjiS (DUF1127 family)